MYGFCKNSVNRIDRIFPALTENNSFYAQKKKVIYPYELQILISESLDSPVHQWVSTIKPIKAGHLLKKF